MLEELEAVFGEATKWNGGDGKFHAVWVKHNFEVAVDMATGFSDLTFHGLNEGQVLSLVAETVVHEEA